MVLLLLLLQILITAMITPDLPTNIVDFRGFDSSIIFIERGGIPTSIGKCRQSLSQAMLVGMVLEGRLGVDNSGTTRGTPHPQPRSVEAHGTSTL